jgi:hypothetical protein
VPPTKTYVASSADKADVRLWRVIETPARGTGTEGKKRRKGMEGDTVYTLVLVAVLSELLRCVL